MRKYVKRVKHRNMASKRTSKSAAKAIISCLIEENDSENADEYFESSDENSNEYLDVQLKFVDENTINLGVSDACNRENWLDNSEDESKVNVLCCKRCQIFPEMFKNRSNYVLSCCTG